MRVIISDRLHEAILSITRAWHEAMAGDVWSLVGLAELRFIVV
jgi:hypothetical protein